MKQSDKPINFPIDLVYLWVDGNDPVWREKRSGHNVVLGNESHNNEARWRNNDELKYSLRSVEKYAPWINRIFIVTDNQCPAWLDTSNPKIQVIDHSHIFPADALPVFNSQAIESVIYKIPGLSEHFIQGNDDTLFSAPVYPSDFFNTDGTTIVRFSGVRMRDSKSQKGSMYVKTIYRMRDMIHEKTGVKIHYKPHHNFDSYRISDIKECVGLGVQVGLVIGGGNFWRGVKNGSGKMQRSHADSMGMLATVMNAIAVADVLEQHGLDARVLTAVETVWNSAVYRSVSRPALK